MTKPRATLALALFASATWMAGQAVPSAKPTRPRKAVSTSPRPKLGYAPRSEKLRWVGEPISLDLKDADLRDVLHSFSELAGLNLVVDPEVRGSVTVRLHDVGWDQALDLIVRINGYGYVLEGNVLRVAPVAKLAGP